MWCGEVKGVHVYDNATGDFLCVRDRKYFVNLIIL